MTTIEVRHDNVTKATFDTDDETQNLNRAFEYIIDHQGQSYDYATRYGGWDVVVIRNGKAYCAVCDRPHPSPGMHTTAGR